MPSVLSLLSLAVSAAAPVDLGGAVQAAAAVVPQGGGFDFLKLVIGASLPVKLVMGLLLAASLMSWTIILGKRSILEKSKKQANAFEERFWSGGER